MSWLFKSLQSHDPQQSTPASPASSPAGVKEDLSAIGQTISRQLCGVATFLAPPPATADDSPGLEAESEALIGIQNDLAEIGRSFKSGLTLLFSNSNRAVSEISRFASNFLQFQDKSPIEEDEKKGEEEEDEDEDGVLGITHEVLQFMTFIWVFTSVFIHIS
ncbi:hypothetical protein L484_013446 [Morus notabilis]|uniref:Uncharacterized protein n=1 Tax=Morus notabilis TaxID=981085 RepID=W9QZC3_9ROSA|nr:hypothetical protein L484_013446 [Morus notabilis]